MPLGFERRFASCNQLAFSETVSTPSYTEPSSYKHLNDSYLLQWAAFHGLPPSAIGLS
jgi:hypothetical protein